MPEFWDSTDVDDYNDAWYSNPLSFSLKTTVFVQIWKTLRTLTSLLDKCIVFQIWNKQSDVVIRLRVTVKV